jgi:hypothetical protein
MGQGVTSDPSVFSLLKEYYGEKVEVLVFRNSPFLGMLKKERVGGKYMVVPMEVSGSAAVTADYIQVKLQAANSYTGVAMQVTPGRLFASFVLDPMEFLASQGDRAAFLSVFALRAMLAMDDLRKVLATAIYHTGYLELGPVMGVDATNHLYVDVDSSTAMAVMPGSYLLFAPTITSAYRDASASIVSTIQTVGATGYTRITFASAYVATVAVGDQLMIKGGRDVSGNPNAPIGLGAWIPTIANRAGSTWTAYIAQTFFNVNRSVAPDRLAGNFVLQNTSGGETKLQALSRLLMVCRRQGGIVDTIIMNDLDYYNIMNETMSNRTFYQQIQGAASKEKNAATQGISQFQFGFSTSWLNTVIDDPYCPKGATYMLDSEALRLYSYTNTTPILDKIPLGNEPGGPVAAEQGELSTNFQFLVDDMYTVSPVDLQSGKGLQIDFQAFCQFAITNPAHCGVCVFA